MSENVTIPGVLLTQIENPKRAERTTHTFSYRYGGLRALMLAVFEDGVRCYLGSSPLLAAEAEAWVFGEATANPFSFPVLCEILGLDPQATRVALQNLRMHGSVEPKRLPRARHNVRSVSRVQPRRVRVRKKRQRESAVPAA